MTLTSSSVNLYCCYYVQCCIILQIIVIPYKFGYFQLYYLNTKSFITFWNYCACLWSTWVEENISNKRMRRCCIPHGCKWESSCESFVLAFVRFMRYTVPCTRDWADKWSFNKLRVTLGVIFSAHKHFCLCFMLLFAAAAAACDNLSCLARFLFAR